MIYRKKPTLQQLGKELYRTRKALAKALTLKSEALTLVVELRSALRELYALRDAGADNKWTYRTIRRLDEIKKSAGL